MFSIKGYFFLVKEWLSYWLKSVDRHSLQSPFIYHFYTQLIPDKSVKEPKEIASLRSILAKNQQTIKVTDFGAGSLVTKNTERKIATIAKTSSSTPRFSIFLKNTIQYFQCEDILELGTSFGFNTANMLYGLKHPTNLHTIEGSSEIAKIADSNFKQLGLENIHLHVGNIDKLLEGVIDSIEKIDLAYLDANHSYEATVRYFDIILKKTHENSIIILDDIHWSPGMKKAWNEIKNNKSVTSSADLFDAGILFFKKGLNQKHYILDF